MRDLCPMLLDAEGRLTPVVQRLLLAVAPVDAGSLARVQVLPHTRNLLRFPWYPARRGGAFVLGERIYMLKRSLRGAYTDEATEQHASLLLLAHEVGHLPQAARSGLTFSGKLRYVLRAARQYMWSALRHGRRAHDMAPLELEADEGRWVLSRLIGEAPDRAELKAIIDTDDMTGLLGWLSARTERLGALKQQYRAMFR